MCQFYAAISTVRREHPTIKNLELVWKIFLSTFSNNKCETGCVLEVLVAINCSASFCFRAVFVYPRLYSTKQPMTFDSNLNITLVLWSKGYFGRIETLATGETDVKWAISAYSV